MTVEKWVPITLAGLALAAVGAGLVMVTGATIVAAAYPWGVSGDPPRPGEATGQIGLLPTWVAEKHIRRAFGEPDTYTYTLGDTNGYGPEQWEVRPDGLSGEIFTIYARDGQFRVGGPVDSTNARTIVGRILGTLERGYDDTPRGPFIVNSSESDVIPDGTVFATLPQLEAAIKRVAKSLAHHNAESDVSFGYEKVLVTDGNDHAARIDVTPADAKRSGVAEEMFRLNAKWRRANGYA